MENRRILKRRGWSIVRKAQIIGATVGALISIGVILFASSDEHPDIFDLAVGLLILISLPLGLICRTFRVSLTQLSGPGWREYLFAVLVIVTNAFILFLVGTCIGWLIEKVKNKRSHDL